MFLLSRNNAWYTDSLGIYIDFNLLSKIVNMRIIDDEVLMLNEYKSKHKLYNKNQL